MNTENYRPINSTQHDMLWALGYTKDNVHGYTSNPITLDELRAMADSGKSYAADAGAVLRMIGYNEQPEQLSVVCPNCSSSDFTVCGSYQLKDDTLWTDTRQCTGCKTKYLVRNGEYVGVAS